MIVTLTINEIKKLMKRKKTVITLIAFILLTSVIAYGTYRDSLNMKKYNSVEFRQKNIEESIKHEKEFLGDPTIPEEHKKNSKENIAQMEQELAKIKLEASGKPVHWKTQLKEQIDEMEKNYSEKNNPDYNEMIKMELQKSKYLYNNNIRPQNEYDFNGFKFISALFMILGTIFLAVGVMIFTADMVSGEFTPPTMKVLLTQPVSRAKVLASKFIAVVLTSTFLIVLVELLAFLIVGLLFGFGNSKYPVIVGTKYAWDLSKTAFGGHPLIQVAGSSYIITMGAFVARMLLMQILFIIACASVAFMFSSVLKSSMVSVSLSIVFIVAVTILQELPFLRRLTPYLFTSYGMTGEVLTGQIISRYNNPYVTPALGIGTLIATTVICYIISHLVFTKRDILI